MEEYNISKSLFSHRKGLIPVSSILLTECMPTDVVNALVSCYCLFREEMLELTYKSNKLYLSNEVVNRELWIHFLNEPLTSLPDHSSQYSVVISILKDAKMEWNRKLDMVEHLILWSRIQLKDNTKKDVVACLNKFIYRINAEFDRLDYGYRLVCDHVVEIIGEEEQKSVEQAVSDSKDNVREHLCRALDHLSKKPNPDVRNSIKESISAVEYVCRDITGESTLGKSLAKLESRGVYIHQRLKEGMEKFYFYSNQPDTGIRHALMDDDGKYVPSKAEAYYMLVTCSAFINFLQMKITQSKTS